MLVFGALTAIAVPRFRLFKEKAYIATLTSDLGILRIAQEAYWSEHQVYSTDSSGLDWKASSRVTVAIHSTDPTAGFTAVATHSDLANAQCMTSVGPEVTASASGDITCGSGALAGGTALTP